MYIQDWINDKYKDISVTLPSLVEKEPDSFTCGFNTGYKRALRDLEHQIQKGAVLRKSLCRCGDVYHPVGAICL